MGGRAAGALIRRPGPVGQIAALVVPAGAALQMALFPPPPDSLMAVPVQATVWLAAATATVLALSRTARRDSVTRG